jgi:prepilin-type N-terminal cleavage/methylation domain-containing protein
MSRPARRSIAARGYTLLEMIIVLVLLVVLVGLAWPSLQKPFRKGQIRGAAKQVRDELLRARLEAINSGTTLVFRFQPGLGVFEVSSQGTAEGELDPEFAVSSDGLGAPASDAAMVDTSAVTDPSGLGVDDSRTAASGVRTGPKLLEHKIRFWAQDLDDGMSPEGSADATLGVDASLTGGVGNPAFDIGPPVASDLTDGAAGLFEDSEGALDFSASASWSPPIIFYPNGRTSNARIRLSDEGEYYVDVSLRGLTGSARIGKVRRWEDRWREEAAGEEGSPADGVLEKVPLETIAPQAGPSLETVQ